MKHRIGIIGYGGMGGWHVNKIATIENIELAGIWDIRECQREKALSREIHVYESLEALLADETVDMVLIATPNDVHKPLAIAAMEAGKNVVCEKPVEMSVAALDEMLDAAKAAKVWGKAALSATARFCATTSRASLNLPSAAWLVVVV